jgi:hypothetical protein
MWPAGPCQTTLSDLGLASFFLYEKNLDRNMAKTILRLGVKVTALRLQIYRVERARRR